MTRVVVRLMGGLGNQLFCYAAARRLALVNHAELVLDDVSGFAYDAVFSITTNLATSTSLVAKPLRQNDWSHSHGCGDT